MAHFKQAPAREVPPVLEVKVPDGHEVQTPAPADEYVPIGQEVQAENVVAFVNGLKEPAGQAMQTFDPNPFAYDPGGQLRQVGVNVDGV